MKFVKRFLQIRQFKIIRYLKLLSIWFLVSLVVCDLISCKYLHGFSVYIFKVSALPTDIMLVSSFVLLLLFGSICSNYFIKIRSIRYSLIIVYTSVGLLFFYRLFYAIYASFVNVDPGFEHNSILYDIRIQIICFSALVLVSLISLYEIYIDKRETKCNE